MSVLTKIVQFSRRLYPKGRAFKMSVGSNVEKIHTALGRSEQQAHDNALSILNSILPDNANFTADDATRWEQRLGMIVNTSVDLEDRKLAIRRKLNHPGTIPARQSIDYIEGQLRAAGFDVYCYRSGGLSPYQILYTNGDVHQLGNVQLNDTQMGDVYSFYDVWEQIQLGNFQLGMAQLGMFFQGNAVINTIEDENVLLLNRYFWAFYIGGATIGAFADVDVNRKNEFRQLILKLKPVNSVAFLYINYN